MTHSYRRGLAVLNAGLLGLGVVACGDDDSSEAGTTTPAAVVSPDSTLDTIPDTTTAADTAPNTASIDPAPTTSEAAVSAGAAELLPASFEARSVVTVDPLLYQAALVLGVEPIGTSTFETAGGVGGPLPGYLPAEIVDRAELFGTILAPNLEEIAAADPELVLASAVFAPDAEALSAITEVAVYEGDFADWRAATRFVGAQLGLAERADALIADIDATTAGLDVAAGSTASAIRFVGSDVFAITESSLGGQTLVAAGFSLPSGLQDVDPRTPISLEQLELFDADVVVVVRQDDSDTVSGPDRFEEWAASPLWQTLTAVEQGNVVDVGPCWATPTGWCAIVVTTDIEGLS